MSIPLPRRTAFGLGFSLLAHAAVLAWLVQTAPKIPPDDAPVTSMQLTLLRLPPPRTEALSTPVPPAPPQTSHAKAASPAAQPKRAAPAAAAPKATEPPPVIMLAPKDEAVVTENAPTQSAAVGFDLQAARGAARAYVKGDGAGHGGAEGRGRPMSATRDEKLGEAIERAKPADCRNAYAGLGVLAVIPLAASAVTGKGCKW